MFSSIQLKKSRCDLKFSLDSRKEADKNKNESYFEIGVGRERRKNRKKLCLENK